MAFRMRGGRHRDVCHAHTHRVRHRVCDGGQRRHNGCLADTTNAVGMRRVRDLQDLRIDVRQIGANRNAVVQETRVLQPAVFAVDVLLVQRPADPLRSRTLELPFDVVGMDGLPSVLDNRITQDFGCAGFRIDFHVTDVACKRNASAVGHNLTVTGNRATRGG